MKILIFGSVLFLTSLMFISCKKDNPIPPGEQPQINLTLEDVSCTEAWIKLSTSNLSLPANVELQKDGSNYQTINLISADTILYIDSLHPNKTYNFNSIIQSGNPPDGEAGQSIKDSVSVTTMDTTSHNFTWQTWTFGGQAGSCTLYDVAVIDENNIWAVGEIYLLDSTGVPDPNAYNAVHWDGRQWELKRIKTNACGGVDYPPIKAIFAFSLNDILFAHIDGSISHYNGIEFTNDCSLISFPNGSANKIWGISKNDFYVVGGSGFIAHYLNGHWSQIESGTDLNINDIWGNTDIENNETEIFAVGGNYLTGTERIILQISDNNQVNEINPEGTESYPLSCIWFHKNLKLYIGGAGLYSKNSSGNLWQQVPIPHYYTYSIRGNGLNDIIVCGGLGYAGHFNGYTWVNYLGNGLEEMDGNYYSAAFKGNIICLVGERADQKAIASIGIR